MARREYKSMEQGGGNLPDVPFAENLVFYAPLTEGDLTEHISGQAMTITGDGGIDYDSAEGAYLITLPTFDTESPSKAVLIADNLSLGLSNQLTTVYSYRELGSANFRPAYFSAGNILSDTYPYALPFVFGGARGSANQWKTFIQVWDTSQFMTSYKNGSIYNEQTISTTITDSCNSGISIGRRAASFHQGSYYLRDLRIYNRALTASEVAQL